MFRVYFQKVEVQKWFLTVRGINCIILLGCEIQGVVLCQKDREWETKPIFAQLVWTALSLNRCGILWQALAEFCPEVGCAGASMRVWLGATVCGCVSGEKRFSWEEFGRGEICPCLLFLSNVWAWAWTGLKICLGRRAIGAGPGCPAGRSVQG